MQLLQHFKELTVRPKNTHELRGLILQFAIQGKLTATWRKENPEGGDTNELLLSIKHYNAEKLKENKRRVSIPKGELKKLDYLPTGWVKVANYDLFNLQKGRNPKDLSETIKTYPYHDIESLDRGNVRRYSDDEKAPKCKDTDILVVCDGSRSGLILDGKPGIVGSTLAIIHTPPFIKDYIKFIFLQDFERANANMIGAAIPHLDIKGLLLTTIGLPPLEEQKEIVKVVEILFKEVEQLELLTVERITLKEDFVTSALNQLTTNNSKQEWRFLQDHFKSFFNETTNIKKLRETVLQLAVQGKLTADWRANNLDIEDASVLLKRIQKEKAQLIKAKKIKKEKPLPEISKDEIPYELPEGWVWCRFYKIINSFLTGPFGSMLHKSDYIENGIPVINPQQLVNGKIIPSTKMQVSEETVNRLSRYILNQGDIVIARRGEMGRCAIVSENENGFLCGTGSFFLKLNKLIQRQFIYLLFQSELIRGYLTHSSNGVTMSNLNQTTLLNMIVPVPPLEEQKAIVQKVNVLMGLCDALEQEVQQTQEHSEQLMQSCLREVFEKN